MSPVLALSLLLAGATEQHLQPKSFDPLPLIADPVAEDEIFNEGTSAPTVSFNLVQGGLATGTIDGGNNIDGEATLLDIFGVDTAIGTSDDDLNLTSQSLAVDAGSNAALPPDRFDLDEDGNTIEPLPIDRSGNKRNHDGGIGSSNVDIGAYEFGASAVNVIEESSGIAFRTYLSDPFPNPATDGLKVRFGVKTRSSVQIIVYDALGREVAVVYDDRAHSGQDYQVRIPTNSLASGVYFVRLMTGTTEISRQFVLAR